jgi:hypothetical protein
MKRGRYGAPSIIWMDQHVMTADDAVDHKPCAPQCRQHLPRAHGRQ